jgi:4-carboxymuconolactone decarboxylase
VTVPDFASPREAARAFTPGLSDLVASPLYDRVWEDPDLSKRDRSLVTVAALIAMGRREELPAHLRRAEEHGVTRAELSALITHLASMQGSLLRLPLRRSPTRPSLRRQSLAEALEPLDETFASGAFNGSSRCRAASSGG